MKKNSSLFLAIVLGIGISLVPLRAQDNPPTNPQKDAAPAAAAAQPQAWAGELIDASCKADAPTDKCPVTENTKLFGLQTADGNYFRFDGDGNTKIMEALKSSEKKTGAIKVSINGTAKEGMLKVEGIEIH